MQESGLPAPVFINRQNEFVVVLYNHPTEPEKPVIPDDAADKTDTEATTEEGKLDITPGNGETIKVAASPIPHAEILAKAADRYFKSIRI